MKTNGLTRWTIAVTATAFLVLGGAVTAAAQDASPLPGDATTGRSEQGPSGTGQAAVVDVRIGTHDGFDRVTFETEGDGQPGWFVEYEEEPLSDGAGEPIEFDGEVALRMVVSGVPLPPDTDAETFLDDVDGPAGSIVNEVVNDSIFEGQHTFVVGLDEEVPYRIGRLSDPDRIVVDLVHDDTPVGGVSTGLGGGANATSPFLPLAVLGGVLLLSSAVVLVLTRRTTSG